MINKFYSVNTGLDEINCFSAYEVYYRMLVSRVSKNKAQIMLSYVNDMTPGEYFVIAGDFGRVEIRCWDYSMD